MKKVNALQLRQSLGAVAAALERTGEPILLERGRKPIGVIVSVKDFQERFVEKNATAARAAIVAEIDRIARKSDDPTPAVKLLRGLRGDG